MDERNAFKRRVFEKIKGECISISRLALVAQDRFDVNSRELIGSLERLVKVLDGLSSNELNSCDQVIGDYIYYPLNHLLSKDELSDRVSELVMRIFEFLFKNCWGFGLSMNVYRQLYAVCLYMLSGPVGGGGGGGGEKSSPSKEFLDKSNELKEASCKALEGLFLSYLQGGRVRDGESLSIMPTFANNITIFLDCLEYGNEMMGLQMAALDAMKILLFGIIDNGDELSLVLPGVVSRVVKLVSGKFGKCNYTVMAKSIDLLSELLIRVVNDEEVDGMGRVLSDDTSTSSVISKTIGYKDAPPSIRSSAWLKLTQDQIKIAIDSIISIRLHSKKEPQISLLNLCLNILKKSSKSLKNCLPTVIDTIIYFINSPPNGDSTSLVTTLTFYLSDKEIKDVIEKRSFNWIDSLPRLLTSHDDRQSIIVINAVKTSLNLLESSSEVFLKDSLIRTIVEVINLKSVKKPLPISSFSFNSKELVTIISESTLMRENSLSDLGISSSLSISTQSSLSNLLYSIGSSNQGDSIINNLLFKIQDMPIGSDFKISTFWIIIQLFRGLILSNEQKDDDISNYISDEMKDGNNSLSTLSSDCILDIMYYSRDIISQATSIRFKKENDTMICLSLQATSLIAYHLGKEFRNELVDYLYPVVEMLGHSNPLIVKQAQLTIIEIAKTCQYETIQSLVIDNADYLVDGMSIKLNTLDISPRTTVILTTLINLAGSSITPYLDDLISTMFVILDNYHGYTTLTEGIFSVFKALVNETEKGYSDKLIKDKEKNELDISETHITCLDDLLIELSRKPQLPDFDSDDEEEEGEDGNNRNKPFSERLSEIENRRKAEQEENENINDDSIESKPLNNPQESGEKEWKSLIPKSTYRVIEHIVNYSDRYLTHNSSTLKYNLIELITSSMTIMSSSKEDFLPLINNIWPVLTTRLDDSDIFIVEATLKCIGIICENAGDFMTSRIIRLWPKLKALFKPKGRANELKLNSSYSPQMRVFNSLCGCFEKILSSTPIPDELYDDILQSFSPYFTIEQAKGLKRELERINSDAIWLDDIKYSKKYPIAPHKSLNEIKI